jgi:hypothetical protein
MKQLPEKLRKNGFAYRLIRRGLRSCIYKQMVSESVRRYEVFQIKVRPERLLYGKLIPAKEIFPHDEAFGYWAWCCWDLPAAMKKFNELEGPEKG